MVFLIVGCQVAALHSRVGQTPGPPNHEGHMTQAKQTKLDSFDSFVATNPMPYAIAVAAKH